MLDPLCNHRGVLVGVMVVFEGIWYINGVMMSW